MASEHFLRTAILFHAWQAEKAAGGRFRGKDYGYHCELGGHPIPEASLLLTDNIAVAQLLLSDLLGHAGRIWDHVAAWARRNGYGPHIYAMNEDMAERYQSGTPRTY